MSVLTVIDGIPLFSTVQEALIWGKARRLNGVHQHKYNDQIGYMGGASHSIAVRGSDELREQTTRRETPTSNNGSGNRGGY